MSILEPRVGLAPEGPKGRKFHTAPDKDTVSRKQQYIFELWREEYRDGIKTRGDKIGMDLCIIKPLNDVRRKFSADHYAY